MPTSRPARTLVLMLAAALSAAQTQPPATAAGRVHSAAPPAARPGCPSQLAPSARSGKLASQPVFVYSSFAMPLEAPAPLRSYNPFVVVVQDLLDERSATVPFPPGETRPSLRRTQRFANEPLPLLLESYERYGPVFTLRLFHANGVFALGPAANHYITVSHASNFAYRTSYFRDLMGFAGDGLLTTDGDFHRASRRIMLPAFHHERILASLDTMLEETSSALEASSPEPPSTSTPGPAASPFASPCARSSASTPTVPPRAPSTPPRLFEQTLSFYARDYTLRMLRGPLSPWDRQQKATRALNRLIYSEISRRRATGERGEDVLSLLIDATDEDGQTALTDLQIRDEVMTLLFAGTTPPPPPSPSCSTSSPATRTWSTRLLAEQDAQLAGALPTPTQLMGDGLPYLEQILDETLRLYPPAWIGPRRSVEPVRARTATPSPAAPSSTTAPGPLIACPTSGPTPRRSVPSASPPRPRPRCPRAPTSPSAAARAPASACASASSRSARSPRSSSPASPSPCPRTSA